MQICKLLFIIFRICFYFYDRLENILVRDKKVLFSFVLKFNKSKDVTFKAQESFI